MYAEWVQSYRDLPILINQWANVMRWEKAHAAVLALARVLWQEGHTAHATEEEASEEVARMLDVYVDVAENVAGVPVYKGEKSSSERFAGATHTYSIEALMPDGRALQAGTSHELGQNFSKAYGIQFSAEDQSQQYAWTTSWGMSWRMLGAMIMVHGDDRGLRLPPKMAPVEAVIVPIVKGPSEDVVAATRELHATLKAAGFRVKSTSAICARAQVRRLGDARRSDSHRDGANDLAAGTATLVRRDLERGEAGRRQRARRRGPPRCPLLDASASR